MNKITNKTSIIEFEAIKAIIVYYRELVDIYGNEEKDYYLEVRNIKNGIFQSGKPISLDFVAKIASEIKTNIKKDKFLLSGKIPENLLYVHNDINSTLVWFHKNEKRKLFFTGNILKSKEYYIPNTIFVFCPDSFELLIYCTDTSEPNEDSQLFYAPYYNTKIKVCNGTIFNAITGFNNIGDLINKITNSYFNSYFTEEHPMYYPGKNGKNSLWKKAAKQPFQDYLLRPTKLKLEDLYEQIQNSTLLSRTNA